ncbi:MAG TPA: tripartite tricarboxylate transporter substrate binding protein [Burkholderiales bacterium]|jgi:tripartite-type tricarboxylate transporter receptor subunit TctC|nr:tripartite tricarboxylate transporter substrate binding protein [Burkholderiales bacterium]
MLRTLLLIIYAAALPAAAQDYPTKPIHIIVGYAAGGGNDIIVRVMQPEMTKGLGQPVIVENKPGAQSIIAAEYAAKAAPDGYTIFMGPSGPMTINPATYSKLPYDPVRDFAPISLICDFPLILAVSAASPVQDVKSLIAYAKAHPDKANYGSSAGIFQVTTELFKQKTGANFVMIPYKSSGESAQAVIAGQVTMTIADPPPLTGPLKAGTLRGLAVTSAKRQPSWPNIPTMAEAGVPDMEVPVWTAFFAPAKTPRAIIERLQKEVARAVQTPEVKERFAQMGLEPVGSTPEALGRIVARDVAKYTAVAKAANIKND